MALLEVWKRSIRRGERNPAKPSSTRVKEVLECLGRPGEVPRVRRGEDHRADLRAEADIPRALAGRSRESR